MLNTSVTQEATPTKRRTTPKWAGTPGYSNVSYVAPQPVSQFNEMLAESTCSAGDDSMVFAAKR